MNMNAYTAALVTGAATRLGRAMALDLGRRGVHVAVHYASSADLAEQTVRDIRDAGGQATTVQADLLVAENMETLVHRAADALGRPLDVLVNNASIFDYDRIDTATQESWDRHIGSNLRAPFFLTQAFAEQAPKAIKDDAGEPLAQAVVVNMIDQRVRKLTPEFMTYTLSKMGLWAFTQTAAQALAPHIRVNAIGPGPTMIGARQTPEHFANQRSATILERGASAQDIVAALNYLLDAPAVTGQLICVDGGQHHGWKTPDILGRE
jgi:NAD(P)-dependent dehydrogenase (short-subunit alcohol dehydrogenase family)